MWNGLELGWNGTKNIQADQFGSFASPKCPKNGPKGPKFLPNRLKITLWQQKLAHMAYVGVEIKAPGCPLLCSNLVSYLPTQNRPSEPKCVAKSQFKPIWPTFWPPWDHNWDILGLANGPNWSAWMSSVPFQPGSSIVLLNWWSHLALIMKMPVLALFGPLEGPNM